jgi:hypothetical protein
MIGAAKNPGPQPGFFAFCRGKEMVNPYFPLWMQPVLK